MGLLKEAILATWEVWFPKTEELGFGRQTMAEEATKTDIFQQQKQTIDTLVNVLERQGAQSPQIIYAQQPEPKVEQKAPNYLLYAALAIGAILLLKKK